MTEIETILTEQIKETAAAGNNGAALPKGNAIEQEKIKAEGEPEPKRGRGRPKGSTSKPPPPPPPKERAPDVLSHMVNGLVVPPIANYLNKEPGDCMFTPEQMKMLAEMQPENNVVQPSWWWYSITAIALLVSNIMQAKEKKEDAAQTPEPIVPTPSRSNPPEVNNPAKIDITFTDEKGT